MYLTYAEYQNYGGSLDKTAFEYNAFLVEGLINRYTFDRLSKETDIPEAVKRVEYALITCIDKRDQALNSAGTVTSRSNDGVSESYSSMSPDSVYQYSTAQMKEIIMNGLKGVCNSKGQRLLYRGLYPHE